MNRQSVSVWGFQTLKTRKHIRYTGHIYNYFSVSVRLRNEKESINETGTLIFYELEY